MYAHTYLYIYMMYTHHGLYCVSGVETGPYVSEGPLATEEHFGLLYFHRLRYSSPWSCDFSGRLSAQVKKPAQTNGNGV